MKSMTMKNLYDLLSILPDDISLQIGRPEACKISLNPLRNGKPIAGIPRLLEISVQGKLHSVDVTVEKTVPAIEKLLSDMV